MRLATENFDFWPISTSIVGTVTKDTTHGPWGAAQAACPSGGFNIVEPTITPVLGRRYFYRFRFGFDVLPSTSEAVLRLLDTTGTVVEVSVSATGVVELWNPITSSHPTGSATIKAGEKAVVELSLLIPKEGNGKLSWRFNGVEKVTDQAMNFRNIGISRARHGNPGAVSSGANVYIDGIAINDDQGTTNNTWAGVEADPIPKPRPRYWGADIAETEASGPCEPAPYNETIWDEFEKAAGRKVGIVHYSDPWSVGVGPVWDGWPAGPNASERVQARGAIGMKSLGGPSGVIQHTIAGDYDAVIRKWAEDARDFARPIFMRLWWEMNGTWFNWGRSHCTGEEYVAAWRHFHSIVSSIAPNVTFVWCPNALFEGKTDPFDPANNFYPGDAYVDWVGMDGYTGQNPNLQLGFRTSKAVFLETYELLQRNAPHKPVMICETACSEWASTKGPEPPKKAEWISSLLEYTVPVEMPNIRAVVWFNWYIVSGAGRVDWPIQSSESATAAFAAGIKDTYYADPSAAELPDSTKVRPPGAPERSVAVIHEPPPDKVAVRILDRKTGQSIARWAEDEPDAANILGGIHKSGDMPGGHKELTGNLARDPRRDYPDLAPYNDVVLEQAGGGVIWGGRLARAPESDGERMAIEPAAVGHREALEDRKGLVFGFIDGDLSKWGEPSAARRAAEGTKAWKLNSNGQAQLVAAGGTGETPTPAAISHSWAQMASTPAAPDIIESWYDSGGIELGRLLLDFAAIKGIVSSASWQDQAIACSDDIASAFEVLKDFEGSSATNQALEIAAGRFFLILTDYYTEFTGESTWEAQWRNLKIIGRQGLVLLGEWPNVGFSAQQMLAYAIPQYTYLEADADSIDDDGFVIPQAWFSEPTDMATVVQELTKYGLYDWFILNGKRFELRKPGTYGRRWQAYAGPSELKETAIDGTRLWDEIIVRWQDVDGKTKTAGPPGSGATFEAEGLRITDPEHPAVKAELTREDILDLGGISESAWAIEAGERWLSEANELARSGEATLRGYILDDKGVLRPVGQIQPGDEIRFPDAGGGTDYRKIVQADYDHDTRTCQVTLDAPKETIQALLERYRAKLAARGL